MRSLAITITFSPTQEIVLECNERMWSYYMETLEYAMIYLNYLCHTL